MKNIKKYASATIILTITLFMSHQISASESINRIVQELKAQEMRTAATIAQWPILISTFPADTPALNSLKSLIGQDIKNIKMDLEKIRELLILLMKKQQEALTIINK